MDLERSKLPALPTVLLEANNLQTSWGSRPDGDTDDNERMTPQVLPAEVMRTPTPAKKRLVRYSDEDFSESDAALPIYEEEESRPPLYVTSEMIMDATFKDR